MGSKRGIKNVLLASFKWPAVWEGEPASISADILDYLRWNHIHSIDSRLGNGGRGNGPRPFWPYHCTALPRMSLAYEPPTALQPNCKNLTRASAQDPVNINFYLPWQRQGPTVCLQVSLKAVARDLIATPAAALFNQKTAADLSDVSSPIRPWVLNFGPNPGGLEGASRPT